MEGKKNEISQNLNTHWDGIIIDPRRWAPEHYEMKNLLFPSSLAYLYAFMSYQKKKKEKHLLKGTAAVENHGWKRADVEFCMAM